MPSKRFLKEVVNKDLNIIKHSYVKVSKRNNENSRQQEKSITSLWSPASSMFAILQAQATKSDDLSLEQLLCSFKI
ncbi:hypothetical protein L2E82_27510 [Cichorium intybus]|uniref:Uncharacterized protein n=1 Tax=Cichorium intybus TaxID=13427 RepID=A0ACB9CTB0_CICIN|nr:hypothetical protein L2E82_27510 [Cichorium intybus]